MTVLQFTLDYPFGEVGDTPARGEQPSSRLVGEFIAITLLGVRSEHLAEGSEVLEGQHVFGVVASGRGEAAGGAPRMGKGPDAEQVIVGVQVARFDEVAINLVTMEELLARERPDARQKNS